MKKNKEVKEITLMDIALWVTRYFSQIAHTTTLNSQGLYITYTDENGKDKELVVIKKDKIQDVCDIFIDLDRKIKRKALEGCLDKNEFKEEFTVVFTESERDGDLCTKDMMDNYRRYIDEYNRYYNRKSELLGEAFGVDDGIKGFLNDDYANYTIPEPKFDVDTRLLEEGYRRVNNFIETPRAVIITECLSSVYNGDWFSSRKMMVTVKMK